MAVYGNSVVLSGLGASLTGRTSWRVTGIDSEQVAAVQRMLALRPGVIVFDTDAAAPDSAIDLWKPEPDVLLTGIDVITGGALVLSGKSSELLTPDPLVRNIETKCALRRPEEHLQYASFYLGPDGTPGTSAYWAGASPFGTQ